MKKILASALLAGLLLGSTSTVFAAEDNKEVKFEAATETADQIITGGPSSTNVTSAIAASYTVTIPSALTLELNDNTYQFSSASGNVMLTKLSAAGNISVTADATPLTLTGDNSLANETLITTLTNGVSEDSLGEFTLEDPDQSQTIKVGTSESSANNLPGEYSGTIDFTFKYLADEPGPDPE
jgi:hypothetical protein